MKNTFKISGMTCNGCKVTVESKINSLIEVDHVNVNLEVGEVTIYSQNQISFSTINNLLPSKYQIIGGDTNSEFNSSTENEKSKLKKLMPLFIILFYISTISILLNYEDWNLTYAMYDFMGLFYIIFSFFKILDLKGFTMSFRMYDPFAKKTSFYAWIYPFIEVLLGLMFLMRIETKAALILTIVVLGITSIGVAQTLINKRSIQCACLGTTLKLPMTEATLIENSIMILMSVSLLIS
jgi:cation transport ATPase